MPTYQYQCQKCGIEFDKFLSISHMYDPEGVPCHDCGERKIKKVITGIGGFTTPESLGRKKPPLEWRNWVSDLKKRNPGSDFNTF